LFLDIAFKKNEAITIPCLASNNVINCMFDTGADTPVWSGSLIRFISLFPDAKHIEHKYAIVSGFGTTNRAQECKRAVYKIPSFKIIGNKENSVNQQLEFIDLR